MRRAPRALASSRSPPVGLGVYYGWADRERPARTRTAGFVAAWAGALAGAWLGFHATTGLLALVTAILGATAAANLVLLALDIARDRAARALVAETPGRGSAAAVA